MSEYIERESAVAKITELINQSGKYTDYECGADDALFIVNHLPAVEMQPVVTCGKCKYGKYTGTEWFCDKHSGHADKFGEDASYHEYHSKHWFCADGEARS